MIATRSISRSTGRVLPVLLPVSIVRGITCDSTPRRSVSSVMIADAAAAIGIGMQPWHTGGCRTAKALAPGGWRAGMPHW